MIKNKINQIKVDVLIQPNAIKWLNKPCWSLGEAHLLLYGLEPVSTRSTIFPPKANNGDDVDLINRSIMAKEISPLGCDENGEAVYRPSDLIGIAEKLKIGIWDIWSALLREKLIKEQCESNKTKSTRTDALTAVIDLAVSMATEPDDTNSAWIEFKKMAEGNTYPPLLEFIEGEGVKYETDDGIKILSKKNFSDRLRRAKSR
ncbi:MAG: hypothetical protein HOO90_03090 [Methylotenera sp.]|uniref:hypothetical protein n=1 Tax=Methylotenera sp. TaxID=2051956 RepID=UPI0017B4E970|nr:hypothetical protein [Methylotenera sp.]NOU24501.1 hypothetical protein [Methylotenera sp.]